MPRSWSTLERWCFSLKSCAWQRKWRKKCKCVRPPCAHSAVICSFTQKAFWKHHSDKAFKEAVYLLSSGWCSVNLSSLWTWLRISWNCPAELKMKTKYLPIKVMAFYAFCLYLFSPFMALLISTRSAPNCLVAATCRPNKPALNYICSMRLCLNSGSWFVKRYPVICRRPIISFSSSFLSDVLS